MAKKKLNLSDLTDQELVEKLGDSKVQYAKLKFSHAVSAIENPMRIRQLRRDIARIYTEISRRNRHSKKN